MDLKSFNAFCGSLTATEKVIQWGGAHVWKVGGKIFAIASHWGDDVKGQEGAFKVSFKCSDLAWEILKEQPGVVPAPYLARAKWVLVQDRNALTDEDVRAYIEAAHAIISSKLTKKVRREIGLLN